MKRIAILFALTFFISAISFSQAPLSAEDVMATARKKAAAENKNVFLIFHASWCGWCHKMDTSMSDPAVKKYFTDNYVIEHLVVQESKNKKQLENPGAEAMMVQYKGEGQGIPFWLIFDKDGKLLADSRMENGDNTGCPAKENEVAHFVNVLKKTSRLKDNELAIIQKRFRRNE